MGRLVLHCDLVASQMRECYHGITTLSKLMLLHKKPGGSVAIHNDIHVPRQL